MKDKDEKLYNPLDLASKIVNRARTGNIPIAKGRLWDDERLVERTKIGREKDKTTYKIRTITRLSFNLCAICGLNTLIKNKRLCLDCNDKYENELSKSRIPEYAPPLHPEPEAILLRSFLNDLPEQRYHSENRNRFKVASRRTYKPRARSKRNYTPRQKWEPTPLEISYYLGRPHYGEEVFGDISRWEEQQSNRKSRKGIIYK